MEGLTNMSPAPDQAGRGTMEQRTVSVGADLRLARERLGWDLASLSARLRIRLPYLEAIEEGRLSDLPGNAYAVGFLRTYATAVGLDADEISRRFRAEVADLNRRTELIFPAPVPERGVPALAVVLVGLVVVIGAYAGWYRLSGDGARQQDETPTMPERLAPLASGLTPLPPLVPTAPPETPSNTPPSAAAEQRVVAPLPVPPLPVPPLPVPVAVPVTLPGSPPPAATPPSGANALAQAAAAPVSAGNAAASGQGLAALASDGGRLALRAKDAAWIQVRDKASGAVVTDRELKPGEVWPVPNRSGLLLTVGNAGGTEVLLDGRPTPSLGADGAVRRGLPLEIDQVRDGKLAASYTPPTPSSNPSATAPRPATQN
jgi:cytoskeleton protein RodZ